MKSKNIELLQARIDVLEAQQAVMAGFVSMLLKLEMHCLPEPQQATLQTIYEGLFEQAIARLLASEAGFSDDSIRAIEDLKINMLGTLSTE